MYTNTMTDNNKSKLCMIPLRHATAIVTLQKAVYDNDTPSYFFKRNFFPEVIIAWQAMSEYYLCQKYDDSSNISFKWSYHTVYAQIILIDSTLA